MKVGSDNWCPSCMCWMSHNDDGNCVKCGTFIDVKFKNYTWYETYGIDPDELNDGDF